MHLNYLTDFGSTCTADIHKNSSASHRIQGNFLPCQENILYKLILESYKSPAANTDMPGQYFLSLPTLKTDY